MRSAHTDCAASYGADGGFAAPVDGEHDAAAAVGEERCQQWLDTNLLWPRPGPALTTLSMLFFH